ncbi:hypothetical protein GH714_011039 [Hevea brasiliensis]|uniref:DUF7356 domain-containing protein n=1 Tax=Hevea brasiliensis TaxID=3981 RepID=A0A6A6MJJ5_HEVBR|nr:hypothetical protein GH714_011039 [Hevea brasiliensis]
METNRDLYLGMILLLLTVDTSLVDSKANVSAKNDLDLQSNNINVSNEQAGDSKKKTTPKESGNGEESRHATKGSHVEECDPSNKCADEEKKLVACLRVPGNDPQYTLLIQNKGNSPLTVTISAPDFVKLETTEIQLQAEQDEKHCYFKQIMPSSSCTIVKAYISLPELLIFRRKQLFSRGSKYERLDMDLPVSSGGKADSEVKNGWDNSWGDDWDDEEALKTPSLSVTTSLSSKGLASRQLSKEGWKD